MISPANTAPLFIHGHGCVSPAGCDSATLFQACRNKETLFIDSLERTVGDALISYPVRRVDPTALREAMPKHPRLRRASDVTKFAITAAHQALGAERITKMKNRELNIGIVMSLMNGCVNYSNRFFGEVLNDPTFASPILFPETVFNAPASHIASYIDCDGPTYTLIGDSSTWFSAIRIAGDWLSTGQVDGCLVICAEEIDWLTSEGLYLYSKQLIASEGAAAIYLEHHTSELQLETLLGPFDYTCSAERKAAIHDAWSITKQDSTLLVDGLSGVKKIDRDELAASHAWQSSRISPNTIVGDAMGARCGFQSIVAIEALLNGFEEAIVLASGGNQHAFSAKFKRSGKLK